MANLSAESPLSYENAAVELRMFWGAALLGMWHFYRRPRVTLGEGRGCDIFLSSELLPTDSFPLLRFMHGDYVLSVVAAMDGEIEVGGELHPLAAYVGRYGSPDSTLPGTGRLVLRPDMLVLLRWGGANLALRLCAAPEPAPGQGGRIYDTVYLNSLFLALVLHAACVLSLLLVPYDVKALQNDAFEAQPWRDVQLAPSKPPPPPPAIQHANAAVSQPHGPSAPARPATAAAPRGSSTQAQPPAAGGGHDALHGIEQMIIGTQEAGGAPGLKDLERIGIRGPNMGDGPTLHGMGPNGQAGLPGTSRDIGTPESTRRVFVPSNPSLGTHYERPVLELETPRIEGALSMDLIKHVVDANRAQVRYCYERALQAHPSLAGRVLLRWVIGPGGVVLNAQVVESALDDEVGECLATKIRGWRFPPPSGGGTVEVRYPFVFRSTG